MGRAPRRWTELRTVLSLWQANDASRIRLSPEPPQMRQLIRKLVAASADRQLGYPDRHSPDHPGQGESPASLHRSNITSPNDRYRTPNDASNPRSPTNKRREYIGIIPALFLPPAPQAAISSAKAPPLCRSPRRPSLKVTHDQASKHPSIQYHNRTRKKERRKKGRSYKQKPPLTRPEGKDNPRDAQRHVCKLPHSIRTPGRGKPCRTM